MAELFKGKKLQRKVGQDYKEVDAEEALKGKVVALYFSAHWCPPCRTFTPVLKDFYEELKDEEPLEIIFVSFDKSDEEQKSYLQEAHGDWLFIQHGDDGIQEMSKKFGVSGIPALIVVKPDGSKAIENGRGDVQSKGPNAFKDWKTACGI